MTTSPVDADAALVHRFLAGDRAALGVIYDRYASRLYAFCRSVLHADADAQDALQDVFVIVATRLSTLRDPERLRAWLFTVARRECLARRSHQRREVVVDDVPDHPGAVDDEPARAALDAELAAILAAAINGLSERDRMLLDLADRHGLPTDEVAEVVGMEPASAYKALTRARMTARRAIGALLVARTNRSTCAELAALLPAWSGDLTPLLRKRIARHIDECATCGEAERRLADPRALLSAMPLPVLPPIRDRILAHALSALSPAGSAGSPPSSTPGSGAASNPPPPRSPVTARAHVPTMRREAVVPGTTERGVPASRHAAARAARRRRALLIAGLVLLILIAGGTIALLVAAAQPNNVEGAGGLGGFPPASASSAPTSSAPPTATSTTHGTAGGSRKPPTIVTLSVSCVFQAATKTDVPELTWKVANATGIALSVNDPAHPGSAGRFGISGTMALSMGSCRPSDGPQTATIRTVGGSGPAATRTVTWNVSAALPSVSPSTAASPSPSPPPSAVIP